MPLLTNKTVEKLQHDLVRYGLIDFEQLTFAQKCAEDNSSSLALELVKNDFIKEKDLLNFIQEKLHIPFVELNDYAPDICCLKYLSIDNAKKYNIFPLFCIEDVLTIAMADPLDLFTINSLFQLNNLSIEPVVCSESSIKNAIARYYLKDNSKEKWQDVFISDNITDELMKKSIECIFKDAIEQNVDNVCLEKSQNGIKIYFDKVLQSHIQNLLVPRFMFVFSEFSHLDMENDNIINSSTIYILYNGKNYSISINYLPTKFGARISANINKPIVDITKYDNFIKKLPHILEKPAFIQLKENKNNSLTSFAYALADFLSAKHSILFVEEESKYELKNINQIEIGKNTAVYFDEIIKTIDMQNFDIIFYEKIYTKEQYEKLKLLSHEHVIFVVHMLVDKELECDYVIDSTGLIR